MAALGFEVHVDKENAISSTAAKNAFGGFSFLNKKHHGFNKKDAPQQTPRKALFDVNKDLSQMSNLSSAKESEKQSPFLLKQTGKIFGSENQPPSKLEDEIGIKKAVSQRNILKFQDEQAFRAPKGKAVKKKMKVHKKQETLTVNDSQEYDSDSIFPRQERLSSYVDKLFAWRPPCLFGALPDSDTESDTTEKNPAKEEDIEELTFQESLFAEDELEAIMKDFPPLSPLAMEFESFDQKECSASEALEAESALTSTPNTSLSLGTLEIVQSSTCTPNEKDFSENNSANGM